MKIKKRHVIGTGIVGAIVLLFSLFKIFTGIEKFSDGVHIMDDYVQDPKLGKLVDEEFPIGGLFHKDLFNFTNTDDGITMWFCVDTLDKKNKKFFLAVEQKEYRGDLPGKPTEADLRVPLSFSKYDRSAGGAEAFLYRDQTPVLVGPPPTQPLNVIREKVEAYRDLLRKRGLETRLAQMSNYAFFQNNKEYIWDRRGLLQRLCEQPGTVYIRYYFAHNPDSKSNKLRVLLFSADKDGRNIIDLPGNKTEKALVLQRSIPPA